MTDAPTAALADDVSLVRRIAVLAALAVTLGLAVQALLFAVKAFMGVTTPIGAFAADIAGGVAWSTVVCTGTAIGVSLMRANALVASAIAALFAPVAVAASKAANQVVAAAVGAAGKPAAFTVVSLAALKAIEYGILGFLLATLVRRGAVTLTPYLGVGAAVGVVFATAIFALRVSAGAAPVELAASTVNEVVFPIGCAAVVYAGTVLGRMSRPAGA